MYIDKNLKFPENNRIEAIKISYNGSFLVCGTVDGYLYFYLKFCIKKI